MLMSSTITLFLPNLCTTICPSRHVVRKLQGITVYGMGKLFSMLLYKKYGGAYVHGIYEKFISSYPLVYNYSEWLSNRSKITNAGHNKTAGDILKAGTGIGSGDIETLALVYCLFMENFASDGGMLYGDTPLKAAKFYSAANPKDNLWAIRPVIGLTNGRVYTGTPGLSSYYNVNTYNAIPTLDSGQAIILQGYGSSNPKSATHEMLYKLNSGGSDAPLLKITPHDGNTATRYYIAIPNNVLHNNTYGRYASGESGADVYPLVSGSENTIDTDGKDAYLFVATLYQNVASSATYNWAERPTVMYGDVNGDGEVTAADTTRLRQWIAGWDVVINELVADVNADGEVTAADVTRLRQYIAGWDVKLGP